MRQQTITPQPELAVAPIEQQYGLDIAQQKAQAGVLAQRIGQAVKNRALELNEQHRQSVLNQKLLQYSDLDTKKRTELLSRQGLNAAGITDEYNQYHTEISEKIMSDLQNKEDRQALQYKFEQNRIQNEDQIAVSQVMNIRKANSELVDANNKTDILSAYQYPTDQNIKVRRDSIKSRLIADASANGLPEESVNARMSQIDFEMATGIIDNFIKTDDYNSAEIRLKSHADLIGGKNSMIYKQYESKLNDLKFTRDLSVEADSIVSKYFSDPNGLTKAYNEIDKRSITTEKKDLLLQRIGQKWNMAKAELQVRTDRISADVVDKMIDFQVDMANGKYTPAQVMNALSPQIEKLPIEQDNKNNLRKQLISMTQSETNKRIAESQRAATAQTAEETKRLRIQQKQDKDEKLRQERDLFNVVYKNPGEISSLTDMINRWPMVDLGYKQSIAKAFGIANTRDIQLRRPPESVIAALDSVTAGLKTDTEKLKKTVELSQYVMTLKAEFIKQNGGREPTDIEETALWNKAATKSATYKGNGFWGLTKGEPYLKFELSQPITKNGKTYKVGTDGILYRVDNQPDARGQ
jgi:hypothetical protein